MALAKAAAPSVAPASLSVWRRPMVSVMGSSLRGQEAISGSQDRLEVAKSRRVRVVAGHAMVALTRPRPEVPVAAHAAVRTVVEVAFLRAMALTTQQHRVQQG